MPGTIVDCYFYWTIVCICESHQPHHLPLFLSQINETRHAHCHRSILLAATSLSRNAAHLPLVRSRDDIFRPRRPFSIDLQPVLRDCCWVECHHEVSPHQPLRWLCSRSSNAEECQTFERTERAGGANQCLYEISRDASQHDCDRFLGYRRSSGCCPRAESYESTGDSGPETWQR